MQSLAYPASSPKWSVSRWFHLYRIYHMVAIDIFLLDTRVEWKLNSLLFFLLNVSLLTHCEEKYIFIRSPNLPKKRPGGLGRHRPNIFHIGNIAAATMGLAGLDYQDALAVRWWCKSGRPQVLNSISPSVQDSAICSVTTRTGLRDGIEAMSKMAGWLPSVVRKSCQNSKPWWQEITSSCKEAVDTQFRNLCL